MSIKLQSKEYYCPSCGSYKTQKSNITKKSENRKGKVYNNCIECGFEWVEIWKLIKVKEVKK